MSLFKGCKICYCYSSPRAQMRAVMGKYTYIQMITYSFGPKLQFCHFLSMKNLILDELSGLEVMLWIGFNIRSRLLFNSALFSLSVSNGWIGSSHSSPFSTPQMDRGREGGRQITLADPCPVSFFFFYPLFSFNFLCCELSAKEGHPRFPNPFCTYNKTLRLWLPQVTIYNLDHTEAVHTRTHTHWPAKNP